MIRYGVICQTFGASGFGLSAAACALTAHLPQPPVTAVSIMPRESGEPDGLPIAHLGGNRLDRVLRRAPGLVPHLLANHVQLVHLHGVWTWAVAAVPALQRHGIRVVISPHGMFEPYIRAQKPARKWLINRLFQRAAVAGADAVHALNTHEALMTADYLNAPHRRCVVIGNGVVAPSLAPPPAGPRVFLYCGRFDPKKDLDRLLDAWERAALPPDEARLDLAGDGDGAYAQRIRERASAMPGVRLLGRVGGPTKAEAFAASHVGILTSHSEGQPIALLESLACGRPVIATTGCRLAVGMGAESAPGWLADDVPGIAKAIRAAVALAPDAAADLGRRSRAHITTHHDWTASGTRMWALYQELIGR